ncbi:serine acetyltransferase [mine drainage metagenome]|uniref:serine O-acetyltransferase n=1 Tax=mine drainage metagenome TaxID=410659 RepID=A0A1J5QV56_9ZZZZ
MIFKRIREEIDSIRQRDPAAHSGAEVLLCYPGLHVLMFYRAAHWCWDHHLRLAGRFLSHLGKLLTGIEIHPGARIGRRLFIDHGTGVVIGETAVVGDDVTLYHGVTLGGTSLHKGKRHPTLEDGVIVGAGAHVLGPVTVGAQARIGANAVVLTDVPAGVTMVGIPARISGACGKSKEFLAYGLEGDLPDPVVRAIEAMRQEVAGLKSRVADLEREAGQAQMQIELVEEQTKTGVRS